MRWGEYREYFSKDICVCNWPGVGMSFALWENSVKAYVVSGSREQKIGDGHYNLGNYRIVSVLT